MNTGLYEQDFYQWALKNAELIREGKLSEVDPENVAEELESMGRSEKRELINRLRVLLTHLLKWEFQPGKRSNSRTDTIDTQRVELNLVLEDSPSLKHGIQESVNKAYRLAQVRLQKETGISRKLLPLTCPYSFEQVMDDEFLPE